ncbi:MULTISPECIES: stalk domain-containing protein [Bacillus]|uniref:stalk domain-containing protein n=1 Tax=Bacillus TaxID=1386 RepID=UPI0002D4EFB9|nr:MULTISPECIES: stalk domain-containing protein [Bacillus]
MGKIFTTNIFIILLATSGILFWQWHVYSEEKESSSHLPISQVEQNVQVQHNSQLLQVTQKISNLQKGTYHIANPLKVKYTIDGQENATNILSVKDDMQTITFYYTIPVSLNDGSILLKDWVLKLDQSKTVKSTIEVVESNSNQGSWASDSTQVGYVNKEFIDYYVFEKEGPVPAIYYQMGNLKLSDNEAGPIIYYEEGMKPNVKKIASIFSEYPTLQNFVVVFTTKEKEQVTEQFIILNNADNLQHLNVKLSNIYLDSIFPFKNQQEKWQQKILNNLYSNKKSGTKKVLVMENVLRDDLTEEKLEKFIDSIMKTEKPLSSAKVDQILSTIKNKRTTFFSDNKNENKPLIPIVYFDLRKVTFNQKPIHAEMVYKDDSKLLPLKSILTADGFVYNQINQGHILLTKDGDSLRLYPGKNVFILNDTDYSVTSPPIVNIGNEMYIYNYWLEDIFGVIVLEEDNEIIVKTSEEI